MHTIRPHIPIALILLLSAALRFGLSGFAPPRDLWADAAAYHQIALNMVNGHGYSAATEAPFAPTRYRTPTYPVFIAAVYAVFGPNYEWVLVVQRLLGICTVYLVFLIAKTCWNTRACLIAALIAAAYPALVYYDNLLLRESLTGFLIACIAYLFLLPGAKNRNHLLGLGALFAVVSMCRPETLVLSGIVGYGLFKPLRTLKNQWRSIALFALPILMVWVPWTARNYVTFGSLSPITNGLGSVLWFGNRWAEIGGDNRTDAAHQNLRESTLAVKAEIKAEEAKLDRTFFNAALRDLAGKPIWFARMTARKMVMFWKDANGVKKTLPAIHPALPVLVNTYYYTLLLLALFGAVYYRRHPQARAIFGLILTYMMVYALLHVRNRYRIPILPLVFVLSAGGFQALWDILRTRFASPSAPSQERAAS